MKQMTINQQSALNIIGSIVVVAINVAINFLLSPYIVENLGVEANGYITLANNFVSYIALVSMALNSMAGRFILIEHRQGNTQSVNEYYSSVLLGDWFLAGIILLPMVLFVLFIGHVINVPVDQLADTKILFAIVLGIAYLEIRNKQIYWLWDVLLFGAQGIAGLIIGFLMFFSVHPTVGSNWMFMLFNPIPLLYLPIMIIMFI